VRHAEFFASEVVGAKVPDDLLHRLRGAADEREEALAITATIAARLRDMADGIQITAVHGSPRTTELVLARVRMVIAGPAGEREEERERLHG
jgi:5,10-methylenetetrahydrofolate reductase